MTPNEFTQGVEAMQLVAIDTLKAVLADHLGPDISTSRLAMDILDDFVCELEGRL